MKTKIKLTRRPKINDLKLGRIFFVPFQTSDLGAFGYIKYDVSTRTNPRSLDFEMCDIYDHICRFDEWSDDIKHKDIKIYDQLINAGHFYKTRVNPKPMLLTNLYTDIIHPVKYGFFKIGSDKYWYDADAKDIVYPEDEDEYRIVQIAFGSYDQEYVEAIFKGETVKYGAPIPGIDY